MKVPAYNPTDRPVVLDAEGHTLGGREHADVDDRTDEVKAAVDRGHLIVSEPTPKTTKTTKSSKRTTAPDADTPSADEPEES